MLASDFSKIADSLRLKYPPAFWLAFNDLVEISQTVGFQRFFPKARFIRSLSDVQMAHEDGLPGNLTPFLLEEQPKHKDYYCFTEAVSDSGNAVVIFASHAIVAEWSDFATFLLWVKQQSAQS